MSPPPIEQQAQSTASETSHSQPYQAPLQKGSGDTIEGSYIVELFSGHSFEDHCRVIRRDMEDYHAAVLKHVFDGLGYACTGVEDGTLDVIRADQGVKSVYCTPKEMPQPEGPLLE